MTKDDQCPGGRRSTSVKLKPETRDRLKEAVRRRGGSQSELIETAIERYLDELERQDAYRRMANLDARIDRLSAVLEDFLRQ